MDGGRWGQRPGRGSASYLLRGPSPASQLVRGERAQGCRRAATAHALPAFEFMAPELTRGEQRV